MEETVKAKKQTFSQKLGSLIGRSKSPGATNVAKQKTIKIRGQPFKALTEKICFDVVHKAKVVDIRDEDFNESQKLLTETFEQYF